MPSEMDDIINEALDQVAVPTIHSEFLRSRGRPAQPALFNELVQEIGDITPEHVEAIARHIETNGVLGVQGIDPKTMRHTHHRLAQLLAGGMDEVRAARLCNYNRMTVSHLKSSPAFQELLAYYSGVVEEEFRDFVRTAADLSMDFLQHLQETLDEDPKKFTPQLALEAIRTLADRSGNAPVSKSISVNVNTDMADRLARARERGRQLGGTDGAPPS